MHEDLGTNINTDADLGHLLFKGDDNGWYAVIGLSTRLFVEQGHIERRRLDAIAAMHRYHDKMREHLTHYVINTGAARPLIEKEAFDYFRSMADHVDDEVSGLVLGLVGFPDGYPEEQPLHNECRIGMSMPWAQILYRYSDWTASMAFSALPAPYPRELLASVLDWAATLKPRHGTSGLSFLIDQDTDHRRITRRIYPHLMRHPGLDYDDGGDWVGIAGLSETIRSVNWLNVLDDGFVSRLGGIDAIAAALGPDCPVHRYDGGIVIQAGPQPEIGDVNYGVVPAHYRTVARLLKPLRFESYPFGLLTPPDPLDPVQETLRWIRRFD